MGRFWSLNHPPWQDAGSFLALFRRKKIFLFPKSLGGGGVPLLRLKNSICSRVHCGFFVVKSLKVLWEDFLQSAFGLEKKFDSILSFVHTSPKITLFKDSLSSKKSCCFLFGKKGNSSIIKTFVVSRERLLFSSLSSGGGLGSGGNFGKTAERERETRASRRRNAESDGVARGMRAVLFLRVFASGTPRTRTTTETTTATLWEEVREEERDEGENEVEKKPGNDGRLGTVVRKQSDGETDRSERQNRPVSNRMANAKRRAPKTVRRGNRIDHVELRRQ